MIPAEHFAVMREQQNQMRSNEEKELIENLPSHVEYYLNMGGKITELPPCRHTPDYQPKFVLPLKRDAA